MAEEGELHLFWIKYKLFDEGDIFIWKDFLYKVK